MVRDRGALRPRGGHRAGRAAVSPGRPRPGRARAGAAALLLGLCVAPAASTVGEMARPSARAFLANFRGYDAPITTKLRLAAENSLKKLRTGEGCCGNHGQ